MGWDSPAVRARCRDRNPWEDCGSSWVFVGRRFHCRALGALRRYVAQQRLHGDVLVEHVIASLGCVSGRGTAVIAMLGKWLNFPQRYASCSPAETWLTSRR